MQLSLWKQDSFWIQTSTDNGESLKPHVRSISSYDREKGKRHCLGREPNELRSLKNSSAASNYLECHSQKFQALWHMHYQFLVSSYSHASGPSEYRVKRKLKSYLCNISYCRARHINAISLQLIVGWCHLFSSVATGIQYFPYTLEQETSSELPCNWGFLTPRRRYKAKDISRLPPAGNVPLFSLSSLNQRAIAQRLFLTWQGHKPQRRLQSKLQVIYSTTHSWPEDIT